MSVAKEEAAKIAANDPCTAAGFCAFELLECEVHQIMGSRLFSATEMGARHRGRSI
ncbi:MAG TPA: hypothetical protein VLA17_02785 [Candidatus Limnocylindria bacterium]|nr:hypothetical protein [Candidatus Limnocylindria bacterium]